MATSMLDNQMVDLLNEMIGTVNGWEILHQLVDLVDGLSRYTISKRHLIIYSVL